MKKWIISIIVVLASLGILCGCGTNVPKGWDTYQLGDKIEYSFAPDWEIIGYGNGESDTAAGFEWMDGEECIGVGTILLSEWEEEDAQGYVEYLKGDDWEAGKSTKIAGKTAMAFEKNHDDGSITKQYLVNFGDGWYCNVQTFSETKEVEEKIDLFVKSIHKI
ncbi:hypothetical protein [Massilioclostridium coli]|uniref:hypothetical protein n=1 Tax=Massilioclostridium coli TaxID=1870991 RepID=UPI0022E8527D|nr:hypothetical protein [Massilioclostridium coli]